MKRFLSSFLSILIFLSFAGCNKTEPVSDSTKLTIVTTIFPYYDFARQVAGDKAEITMLLSPGAESHDYEPSPQDIIKINNADLFIYNGGDSDEWVETILSSLDSDVKTLCMFDYVTPLCSEEDHHHHSEEEHSHEEHNHGEYDEHIWTSLTNATTLIDVITEKIAECDEANKDYYQNRSSEYVNSLSELNGSFIDILSNNEKNTIVVADRFPMLYFTDSLNLEYKSLFPGCSSETQPSISSVTEMIDYVNENDIPVVFHIDTTNEKFAQLVSEDTGAGVRTLYSCHNVTKEQFENGATYLSLMELNLTALMEAF